MYLRGINNNHYPSFEDLSNGAQKPRGLENAALQHMKHDKGTEQPSDKVSQPAEMVSPEIPEGLRTEFEHLPVSSLIQSINGDSNVTESDNEASSGAPLQPGTDIILAQGGIAVKIHARTVIDNGDDTLIIGEGAKLKINSRVGIENGDSTIILGEEAKLKINSRTGIDNGNDTLIVGAGADLKINSRTDIDNGNDTLIIGDGAKALINERSELDNGNDTIIIDSGSYVKLSLRTEVNSGDDALVINGRLNSQPRAFAAETEKAGDFEVTPKDIHKVPAEGKNSESDAHSDRIKVKKFEHSSENPHESEELVGITGKKLGIYQYIEDLIAQGTENSSSQYISRLTSTRGDEESQKGKNINFKNGIIRKIDTYL